MPFSEILQLYVPSLFPLAAFEGFVKSARAVMTDNSQARREFGGASNIIGWRFRACVEDKEGYMASWRQYGSDVSFDAIYLRERLLFGTFVSGVSCVEAAIYACYALASDPSVFGLEFGEETRRHKSGARHLLEKIKSVNESLGLVSVLHQLLDSDEWKLWKDFRNTMTHRSNLPCIIHAAIGGPLPPSNPLEFASTWSSKALCGDEAAFDQLLRWLSGSLEQLFQGGTQLANKD